MEKVARKSSQSILSEKLFSQLAENSEAIVSVKIGGRFRDFRYCQILAATVEALAVFDVKLGCWSSSRPTCVICGPTGYQWLLAALACFFRGYRVIALPEKLTASEVQLSLTGIHVDFAVATVGELGKLDCLHVPLIDFELIPEPNTNSLSTQFKPHHPHIDIVGFTSGTTSDVFLKAFPIDADSIDNFGKEFAQSFRIGEKDRWLITSPFSHVVHLEYAITALSIGCNLIISSPTDFIVAPETLAPSVLVTVPAVYQALIEKLLDTPAPSWNLRLHALFSRCPDIFYSLRYFRAIIRFCQSNILRKVGSNVKVMIIGAGPSDTAFKKNLLAWGLPLYEGYGISEVGMISCNTPRHYRLGSIGSAFGGISITLTPFNEVVVEQIKIRSLAYINGEKQPIVDKTGAVHTGDIAIRKGDFLYLSGRAKDLIVLDRGKNINPTKVETAVGMHRCIGHCVVHGHGKPYLVALIEASHAASEEEIQAAVDQANNHLASHERIRRHIVIPSGSLENQGLITRSLKLKRNKILEVYSGQFDVLYH